MKDLRKKEFIEMLQASQIEFEEKNNFIKCNIPSLGSITYYPKADKVQIDRNNHWEQGGFEFVKNILGNPTKVFLEEVPKGSSCRRDYFENKLRDDFAMAAMQSLLSSDMQMAKLNGNSAEANDEILAITSYRIADSMLKQREL
ncbi:MAG: hypothetical protein ACK518_04160 [bacterium]|jgi:hypothetical protein